MEGSSPSSCTCPSCTGADGEPIHYIAQVEDVTARKQAEEEQERLLAQLDAERRTLQTVFDSAPIPPCCSSIETTQSA